MIFPKDIQDFLTKNFKTESHEMIVAKTVVNHLLLNRFCEYSTPEWGTHQDLIDKDELVSECGILTDKHIQWTYCPNCMKKVRIV